uniref:Uncharacterized protein n=1 Tax=Chromera velia CCMP2878 TaxID=1169474 RepID=A0A0G4GWF7_9ALVE|eukprot:Cvel_5319.t1-p1 / transcript=Cvel_5319.t1 / gene=Cvel_5319 / organism=Chromera_velia_CCMP2878 / gene_product=hypothetical protein / transcript_product=hypothetical protein / location=Cvel_scaffold246:83143-84078(-) / protein_length=312 / sequence_SO=supercontig / SO=protein_coding / is_pseudo=false
MAIVNQPWRIYYAICFHNFSTWFRSRQRQVVSEVHSESRGTNTKAVCETVSMEEAPEKVKRKVAGLAKDFPFFVVPPLTYALQSEKAKRGAGEREGGRESSVVEKEGEPPFGLVHFAAGLPLSVKEGEPQGTEVDLSEEEEQKKKRPPLSLGQLRERGANHRDNVPPWIPSAVAKAEGDGDGEQETEKEREKEKERGRRYESRERTTRRGWGSSQGAQEKVGSEEGNGAKGSEGPLLVLLASRKALLAIIVLLNLNCLFQYSNAVVMWGWAHDYQSRPFWMVIVFLVLSFGCGRNQFSSSDRKTFKKISETT